MERLEMNTVRTQLIKIGNSRGIRIPKPLIDQVKLGNEVEIGVQRGQLVIRPVSRPRSGWDEQFRAMAEHGDDQLLEKPVATKWDRSDWVW
jgi:antitoxin MazE